MRTITVPETPKKRRLPLPSPAQLLVRGLFIVLTILALCNLENIFSVGQDGTPIGPVAKPGYGWWLAWMFLFIQVGTGRVLTSLLPGRLPQLPPGGPLLFNLTLGLYSSALFLSLLSLVGLLKGTGVVFYLAIFIPLALRGSWIHIQARRARAKASAGDDKPTPKLRDKILGGLILAAIATPYLLQTLVPDSDWDGALYHLPMSLEFLKEGIWSADYQLSAFYRPGSVHLIYSLFLLLQGEAGLIPLNFMLIFVCLGGTYSLARHFWSHRSGLWAVAILISVNLFLETGLDLRVEPFLAAFFLATCYAFLLWRQDRQQVGLVLITAMVASMVIGTKYNGLVLAPIILAPAVLLFCRTSRIASQGKLKIFTLALACFLLPGGIWYLRNATLMNNPVYPYLKPQTFTDQDGKTRNLRKILQSMPKKTARRIKGKRNRDKEGIERLADKTRKIKSTGAGPGLLFAAINADLRNFYGDPKIHSRYTTKTYHWLSPFLLLFLLLPLVDRSRQSWWLIALILAGYLLLSSRAGVIRYLMALFPLMSIGAGVVLARVRAWWFALPILLALATWTSQNVYAEYGKAAHLAPARYILGKENQIQFLSRVGYNGSTAFPHMIATINDRIARGRMAKESRIFMIGEAKGYLLNCDYQPSVSTTGNEWLVELSNGGWQLDRVAQSLKRQGFTHILVDFGWLDWNLMHEPVNRKRLRITLHYLKEFIAKHVRPHGAIRSQNIILHRLKKRAD